MPSIARRTVAASRFLWELHVFAVNRESLFVVRGFSHELKIHKTAQLQPLKYRSFSRHTEDPSRGRFASGFLCALCVSVVNLLPFRSQSQSAHASACRKSSIKSAESSSPIETRTVPGSTPAARNSVIDIR